MYQKDRSLGHSLSIFGIVCDWLMISQDQIQIEAVIDSEKPQKQPQKARN